MQRQEGIPCNEILQSILFTALARCSRKGKFGVDSNRCRSIFEVATQIWSETTPNVVGLVSALNVCACVELVAALDWAEQLWAWAHQEGHSANMLVCSTYARVLESHNLCDRVDKLIYSLREDPNAWGQEGFAHKAFLGSLLDINSKRQNWQRADRLWQLFVHEYGIEPDEMQYCSLATAHLLSGRPHVAANRMEESFDKDLKVRARDVVNHAQSLALIYHSSLLASDLQRLTAFVKKGASSLRVASKWEQKTWQHLVKMVERLKSKPTAVSLQDVLVEWKAKTLSVMRDWGRLRAGSNYFSQQSTIEGR